VATAFLFLQTNGEIVLHQPYKFRVVVDFVFPAVFLAGSNAGSNTASELPVSVNVYNAVDLSSGELSRAEQKAGKVFQAAGITLLWAAGLLVRDLSDKTPIGISDRASLQLRLWPRAMAGNRPSSAETLGFCLSLENGDAVVLADTIRDRAVFGPSNFADLLGLAIAHELGHLLLRSSAHSVTGIMRRQWTEKQLGDDDRGYLRFTANEAESMRNEVRRRTGLTSAC
jgi:hypothetical protein